MLGLPLSTEFNKRIPKQKFYDHLDQLTPALKKAFSTQIRLIYWRNKLAPTTLNLAAGEQVTEIEVFELKLNEPTIDIAVLKQIDQKIPYHILYILEYEGKYQAWIGYKEAIGQDTYKLVRYYHTDWMNEETLPITISGLDMDTVYDNFVRQIAGDSLRSHNAESLKESIERETMRANLQKQISALETKIRKEKQLNRQMSMNTEMKTLRKQLEKL